MLLCLVVCLTLLASFSPLSSLINKYIVHVSLCTAQTGQKHTTIYMYTYTPILKSSQTMLYTCKISFVCHPSHEALLCQNCFLKLNRVTRLSAPLPTLVHYCDHANWTHVYVYIHRRLFKLDFSTTVALTDDCTSQLNIEWFVVLRCEKKKA